MKSRNCYDLNFMLVVGNILICAVGLYLFYKIGGNRYVDTSTVILLCIFGMENLLILLYEKKKRDPFILLLLLISLGFYMGRVVTLLYDPWSRSLAMFSFTPDDLNYSLIFIMLSNLSIFLGLSTAGRNILYKKSVTSSYSVNPRRIMGVLLFVFFVSYCLQFAGDIIGRFAGYIMLFVNVNLILLFTFIYLAMNFNKVSNTNRIVFLTLIIFFALEVTLSGSRSALLVLACYLLVAILSVKGKIIFSKKMLLISIIIIPVSLFFFILATYIRNVDSRHLDHTKQLTILKEADLIGSKDISHLCRPIFGRIGFLDYSTILIRNQERYSKIINFRYYFESIIDNALTPGFDVFDTPRVSHSMSYISRGESVPTHGDIKAAYQSNMPTVYGEYYVLFHGYPALIIIFVFSYIFKRTYLLIRKKDAFLFYLYRALVLYVFYLWLNSFGIDWILMDLIGIIITVGLFKKFYKMRSRKLKPVY